MRLTLTPTDQLITVNGVPARVWIGETDEGIAIQACITRIAVSQEVDCAAFERALRAQPAPTPERPAFSMRMVL